MPKKSIDISKVRCASSALAFALSLFSFELAAQSPNNGDDSDEFTEQLNLIKAKGQYFRSLPPSHPHRRCIEAQDCGFLNGWGTNAASWAHPGLNTICGHLNSMSYHGKDHYYNGHHSPYVVTSMILAFAGVDKEDDEEVVASKTRAVAPAIMNLTCNSPNFRPKNGNFLKYAVAKQFDYLIVTIAHRWKWGEYLNVVDAADGQTLLDFAYGEYAAETARNSSIAGKISTYIKVLESNGAKRAEGL